MASSDETRPEESCKPGANESGESELATLRNHNVALWRELGVLRWEYARLLERQPQLQAGVVRAQGVLRRKFPALVERLARLKRIIRNSQVLRAATPAKLTVRDLRIRSLLVKAPILIAADVHRDQELQKLSEADQCTLVVPGAGTASNLPAPPPNVPTLYPPAADSLAAYLVEHSTRFHNLNTIVVNHGDDASLALLRGRFRPGQSLLIFRKGNYVCPGVAELGAPQAEDGEFALYTTLPAHWTDPMDAEGKPIPEIVGKRDWPKISVVFVSFNQAEFVEEGIRSVLDQDYPNLEFIVIDGKSTDGSVEILERYRDRVHTMIIEPDKGQSDGLNKGFRYVSGDILTWLNSDDLLEPGALFRVAQAFSAHKVDLVAGGCRQTGTVRTEILRNHHNTLPFGVPVQFPLGLLLEMDRFWLNASFFCQPEVFFSRDIWERSGGRLRTDLHYVMDYDLWVRMAAAGGNVIHIPDFLACSRLHEKQKTVIGMPFLPEVQRLLREYGSKLVLPRADSGLASK